MSRAAGLARALLHIALGGLLHAGLLAPTVGYAGAPETEDELAAARQPPGLRGVFLVKTLRAFHRLPPADEPQVRMESVLEVEWARRLTSWSDVRLVTKIRGDNAGFADDVSFQIPETTRHRSIVDLEEGFLRLTWTSVELRLGKQIFAWGTADAVNPTDYLNPYDFLDVVDHRKIGVYSASLDYTLGPLRQTIVLIPTFTPSRDLLATERWGPVPSSVSPASSTTVSSLRSHPGGSDQGCARELGFREERATP